MPKNGNEINHSAKSPAPQGQERWENLGVAVPWDMKVKIVARAKARGLRASPYARMLLIAGMASEDRAA